jgi:hypothetical protein
MVNPFVLGWLVILPERLTELARRENSRFVLPGIPDFSPVGCFDGFAGIFEPGIKEDQLENVAEKQPEDQFLWRRRF